MILGLGIPELLIILVVILVIFGPKNLPKLGKSLGQTVKNVREGMEGDEKEEVTEGDEPAETSEPKRVTDKSSDPIEVYADDDDDADVDDVVESDVVFCSKCGAKNAADAAFCSKCGNKLA